MKVVSPSRGSVLVLTLVFFIIFVVITVAWMRFAVVQNNAVVGNEQTEQSFHLSEAGINYTLHILNNGLCTPAELAASEPIIQEVVDESVSGGTVPVGTYELTFVPQGNLTTVRALGYDVNVANKCQLIEATLSSFSGVLGTRYKVQSWDHKATFTCSDDPGAVRDPIC